MTALAAAFDRRAPLVRVARTGVVGLVVCGTAAAAHTAAGGSVSAPVLLGVAGAVSVVAMLLGGRTIAPSQVLGLMVVGQAAVHLTSGSDQMISWPAMLALHAAATAISLWTATRAETWLVSLADRLVGRLRGPRRVAVPPTAAPPALVTLWRRTGLEPVAVVEGRGPPRRG